MLLTAHCSLLAARCSLLSLPLSLGEFRHNGIELPEARSQVLARKLTAQSHESPSRRGRQLGRCLNGRGGGMRRRASRPRRTWPQPTRTALWRPRTAPRPPSPSRAPPSPGARATGPATVNALRVLVLDAEVVRPPSDIRLRLAYAVVLHGAPHRLTSGPDRLSRRSEVVRCGGAVRVANGRRFRRTAGQGLVPRRGSSVGRAAHS